MSRETGIEEGKGEERTRSIKNNDSITLRKERAVEKKMTN